MTDPELRPDSTENQGGPVESVPMPRWVPVLIGGTLVVMAALAVYTGMRYRAGGDTLTAKVKPQRDLGMTSAPPGEPDAGASLVMHGEGDSATPSANEPVAGQSRAVITGGPGGVASTVRMWARRGMLVQVEPGESMVYVNDVPIGQASQFDTADEVYDFAAIGSYTVRVVAPGGATRTYIVTAAEDAPQELAWIKVSLD